MLIMDHLPKNKPLIALLLIGLTVRLLLLLLPGFKIDVNDWFAWAVRLDHFNFSQFYSKEVFTDYSPGYLYILALLGFLKSLFRLSDATFYLLLKFPATISDLIISLLVYKEVQKYISSKIALLGFVLVLFNPAIIFNSSIWGQIDSILALLMLAVIIMLKRGNLILSSVFFGLALMVKPQALVVIPILIIFLVTKFSFTNLTKLILPSFVIILILAFPFFPKQTLASLVQHTINTTTEYPYTSLNAYNLWGIVGFWINDGTMWNNFSYQVLGHILFIGFIVINNYFFFKKRLSLYALSALLTLGFFFLPTRVHERYLYPTLIFLIILAVAYKSRLLLVLTSILSLMHFLNLYYVYVYYNEIYLKLPKILYNPILYNFLAENSKNLSLISTVVFLLIAIGIINQVYVVSKKD